MGRRKPVAPRTDVRGLLLGTFNDVEAIARSTAARQKLLAVLRDTEKDLARRLRSVPSGAPGTRFTNASMEAYQHHAALATRYVQKRLDGLTRDQAVKSINRSLTRTTGLMEGLDKRFSGVARPLRLREAGQLRVASSKATGLWARQFPTSVDRYGTRMLGQFEETIRKGLIQGMTTDQLIGALTGHGGPTGTVSLRATSTPTGVIRLQEAEIPEGLFVRNKYWADRLIRTEVLKAYNGARQVAMEEMRADVPDVKKKIIAILDNRTAFDSVAVNGQIRALDDYFIDGAGRQYLYPPARPNDRETTIPWRDVWEKPVEDLSEIEKAVLGELSEEAENKLIDALKAKFGTQPIAKPKPTKTPAKVPKPSIAKPTPPMQQPIAPPAPPTLREKLRDDYVNEVVWEKNHYGSHKGYFGASQDPIAYVTPTPDGKWTADWRGRGTGANRGMTVHDSLEAAKLALRPLVADLATESAAVTALKFSEPELRAALAAEKGDVVRSQVRALLAEHGVLPRDPMARPTSATMTGHHVSPGAEATHGWDGVTHLKPGAMKAYATQPMTRGIQTIVHEELHGSTPWFASDFYRGAGAAIEECSVEMAARKITGGKGNPVSALGAYNGTISQLATILVQEAKVTGMEAFEKIADAGIKMRAPGALDMLGGKHGGKVYSEDGIIDLFMAHLPVPDAAKAGIRKRVWNELRL